MNVRGQTQARRWYWSHLTSNRTSRSALHMRKPQRSLRQRHGKCSHVTVPPIPAVKNCLLIASLYLLIRQTTVTVAMLLMSCKVTSVLGTLSCICPSLCTKRKVQPTLEVQRVVGT